MEGMTIIVKTVAIWVKVLIFVFGVYVIIFGDTSPGGGFAGGAVLASLYVLLMLAFGRELAQKKLPSLALKIACGAVFAFIAMATCGLFFDKNGFFWNFIYQEWLAGEDLGIHFIAAGIIPLAELAIGLAVGALVFLVILNLSTFRHNVLANERK